MPHKSLQSFIKANFIVKDTHFIPINPSDNLYRHYGIKSNSEHVLFIEDVIHIYGDDAIVERQESLYLKVYIYVRNLGYNLFRPSQNCIVNLHDVFLNVYSPAGMELGHYLIYKRHKHFNRKTDTKIGQLYFVRSDECVDGFMYVDGVNVVAVMDGDTFSFLRCERMERLSKYVDRKCYKRSR